MSNIAGRFAQLSYYKRTGLIVYLTTGFPDIRATLELVPALVRGGADLIELGIPFSDPLADGATIQRASMRALEQGVTMRQCMDTCRALREQGVNVPILLMGYYNPILRYGLERFCTEGFVSGIDGVIVPDLPPEEAEPLLRVCKDRRLDLIFMLAPTSTEERIAKVAGMASGFIYCVSLTGVTGARRDLSADLPDFLARVRRHTSLPLAIGFGISSRQHVEAVGRYADAAVVGSALIDVIERSPREEMARNAQAFVEELTGRRPVEQQI
ncbi:MAG: tryptophan synthase subunit alpha [Chloroflexi bacterium]|nr:tryptophan synthase subunit alpha [Chloroflexota bacterium]